MKYTREHNVATVKFVLSGTQIVDLVTYWHQQSENRKIPLHELTITSIRNIVAAVLERYGLSVFDKMPESVILARQDTLAATKGLIVL